MKPAQKVESDTGITVGFPSDLFNEIKRIAAEERWPLSKAVIFLAKLGQGLKNNPSKQCIQLITRS